MQKPNSQPDRKQPAPYRLLAILGLSLLALTYLAATVRGSQPSALDLDAIRWAQSSLGWLDPILRGLTAAGYSPYSIFSGVVVTLIVLGLRNWRGAVGVVVSFAGAQLLVELLKRYVERPRPPTALYLFDADRVRDTSFPSGHVAIATAMFGFCIYLLWAHVANTALRYLLTGLLLLVIGLMGCSRLYAGHHFLSDVAGGYLLGLGWLMIVIVGYKAARSRLA